MYGERVPIMFVPQPKDGPERQACMGMTTEQAINKLYPDFKALGHGQDFSMTPEQAA